MGGHRPAALTPSAARTAELMEARSNFRTTFEHSLGCRLFPYKSSLKIKHLKHNIYNS